MELVLKENEKVLKSWEGSHKKNRTNTLTITNERIIHSSFGKNCISEDVINVEDVCEIRSKYSSPTKQKTRLIVRGIVFILAAIFIYAVLTMVLKKAGTSTGGAGQAKTIMTAFSAVFAILGIVFIILGLLLKSQVELRFYKKKYQFDCAEIGAIANGSYMAKSVRTLAIKVPSSEAVEIVSTIGSYINN